MPVIGGISALSGRIFRQLDGVRGALALYVALLCVYLVSAGPERLSAHTPFNHFALQAEAWLDGRLSLAGAPPDYAQGNDFALFKGRWYVAFPALPAALILPLVALAGEATRVRDGQFFVWLAPVGPVVFWLALQRMRQLGLVRLRSGRAAWLTCGLALGSVYWFTAVQGSVWFAAHVVGVAMAAGYLWASLGAGHPLLAGVLLGLAFWTRASLLFMAPLFLAEAWRVFQSGGHAGPQAATAMEVENRQDLQGREAGAVRPGASSSGLEAATSRRGRCGWRGFGRRLACFAAPVLLLGVLAMWHNTSRFEDPFDFGYRHLQVAWQARIHKWGLFHFHFLPRNLGVLSSSLPWVRPLRISGHGLALWVTTPLYLILLWPRRPGVLFRPLLFTAACVAAPGLLYQNTGWIQFGSRFSNDYSVFLFAALATSGHRFGTRYLPLLLWGILVNGFGALTFDKKPFRLLYDTSPPSQVFQRD